ncbi:hypothetical protein VP01_1369g5 [Puccinia sorghi]|uniref:Uncharacterized protein n=1 Tax=Puccinia sorghi TaxID=27349 RepID=A0A0L6VLR0_9BASI|nr:hypothetical protein VP01_1369g5 [Puccinia sorghi]
MEAVLLMGDKVKQISYTNLKRFITTAMVKSAIASQHMLPDSGLEEEDKKEYVGFLVTADVGMVEASILMTASQKAGLIAEIEPIICKLRKRMDEAKKAEEV